MPRALTPHIGIYGRTNSGKSTLINKLTGQPIAIVSEQAGTTTDPVKKSIEIFGIGPVILIDTAGIDDTSTLGKQRVEKTYQTLKEIDCAILVIADNQFGEPEEQLITKFKELAVPYIMVNNLFTGTLKSDAINLNVLNDDLQPIIEALKQAIPESAYK